MNNEREIPRTSLSRKFNSDLKHLPDSEGGTIAKRDVANLLHIGDKQAYRLLRKLVDEGELELVGRGGSAHYVVREKR